MPKKNFVHNYRNLQTPSMSPPRSYTVGGGVRPHSPPEDEDDDDICPVCESECTCHNRANPATTSRNLAPMATSTSTSTSSSQPKPVHGQSGTNPPLKIKLTVPPNLKFRKDAAASASSPHVNTSHVGTAIRQAPFSVHPPVVEAAPQKRRGRPPKAVVAAREAAKAALANSYTVTNDHSRVPTTKTSYALASTSAIIKSKSKPLNKKVPVLSRVSKKTNGRATTSSAASHATFTDSSDEDHFPTFMSAASTSSLTSSSESDEITSLSSDSEIEEEEQFIIQNEREKLRVKKELLGDDSGQRRRDHAPGSRWEIKPRKKSVGLDGSDSDASGSSSDEDEIADDEEDGEEDEEDNDAGAEADVEEDGLAEVELEAEEDRYMEDTDGKLGVSFDGLPTGWSEDDEESSFDADIFFANLDDSSSDESSPPAALQFGGFASEDDNFSADEEDALLLMDVDPSAQIRRVPGEFEVGIDLDNLSLGLDGLLPSPFGPFETDLTFNGSTESDVDMTASDGATSTEAESDEMALVETDGETTEDELVDSDGLPNSRAMMLFRWPTTVSTVDPLSTMSPGALASPPPTAPPNASRTTRMALASMSAQRSSSAPTPADILAGKISMDDLDDIEIFNEGYPVAPRSTKAGSARSTVPTMGQFLPSTITGESPQHVIIDGSGAVTPSPFPRSRLLRAKRRRENMRQSTSSFDLSTDAEPHGLHVTSTPVPSLSLHVPSSDELGPHAHPQSSDEPPSTDAIELDDVLDASLLGPDTTTSDVDASSLALWGSPKTPASGTHMRSLTRWDHIPVATFRRTRESTMLEGTPVSDSGLGNRFAAMSALVNHDMLGTPKTNGKSKSSKSGKKRSKGKGPLNLLVVSPVLMPIRDGDRTPTNAGPSMYNPFQQDEPLHNQKSRRDQRKEKAMLKRKMSSKYTGSPARQQHHHHRHHYPNTKSRASSSAQRTQSFASSAHVPHLNI